MQRCYVISSINRTSQDKQSTTIGAAREVVVGLPEIMSAGALYTFWATQPPKHHLTIFPGLSWCLTKPPPSTKLLPNWKLGTKGRNVWVIYATSELQPYYNVWYANCWWLARCASVLLEILASSPSTPSAETTAQFNSRAPLHPLSPLTSIPTNVTVDMDEIQAKYDSLVCRPRISLVRTDHLIYSSLIARRGPI